MHTPPTSMPFINCAARSSTVVPEKPTIISWPTFCSSDILCKSAIPSPFGGGCCTAAGQGARSTVAATGADTAFVSTTGASAISMVIFSTGSCAQPIKTNHGMARRKGPQA